MRPAVFHQLQQFGCPLNAPSQSVVLEIGEPSQGAYLVISGRVRLSLPDDYGAALWSRTAGEGVILGLSSAIANDVQCLKAVAMEPTTLAFVEGEKLRKLVRDNPVIGAEILELLSAEVTELHRKWSMLAQARCRHWRRS